MLFFEVHAKFYRKFCIGTFYNSDIIICDTEELRKPLGENFRYLVCNMTNIDHLRVPKGVKKIYLDKSDLAEVRSTAEHAIYLLFKLLKKEDRAEPGRTLYGKKAFIFGIEGRVGKQLKEILEGFGVKVKGHDIKHISIVNENAFKDSDFVFMSTTATPNMKPVLTEHLITTLKPGAYIVNTSRSQAVDIRAINKHIMKLGGFASDFFEDKIFDGRNRFFCTKHSAGFTYEDLKRTSDICFDKFMKLLEEENENEKQKVIT